MSCKLPKYGIVQWRDATGAGGPLRLDRLTKNLPIQETLGWLFEDREGTLAVIQERRVGAKGIQRNIELTLVPRSWVVNIIPLLEGGPDTPAAEGKT